MTDTDALIERIARAAATSEGFGPDQPDHEDVVGEYMSDSAFFAPFIAIEVRKAKAEALREAASEYAQWIGGNRHASKAMEQFFNTRADRIESGDSDEHR